MSRVPATVVALFVRVPVPGRVKTRLAAGLGAEGACDLYRAMVADVIKQIRTSGLPLHLFHDGDDAGGLPQAWMTGAAGVWPQRGGDIGQRMAAAFAQCFALGIDQVILVGSDLPDLAGPVLAEARAALREYDAVLGPAADGGYGLIALKREQYQSRLFAAIPWSTAQVLRVTRHRLATSGLTHHLLPVLRDIDTLDDLLAYGRAPSPWATATNHMIERLLAPSGPVP